jgi:predicted chitinase
LRQNPDGFCTTEEYASGEAYQGRVDLDNTHPGDGVRFKGRGLIMITGRYNYTQYGKLLGLRMGSCSGCRCSTSPRSLQIR